MIELARPAREPDQLKNQISGLLVGHVRAGRGVHQRHRGIVAKARSFDGQHIGRGVRNLRLHPLKRREAECDRVRRTSTRDIARVGLETEGALFERGYQSGAVSRRRSCAIVEQVVHHDHIGRVHKGEVEAGNGLFNLDFDLALVFFSCGKSSSCIVVIPS